MPNFSTFSQHHYPRTKYYCIKKISCCTNTNWCKHMQLLQCSAAKQTSQLELSGEHEGAHPTGNQCITSHSHPPSTVRVSRALSLDFSSKTFSCIQVLLLQTFSIPSDSSWLSSTLLLYLQHSLLRILFLLIRFLCKRGGTNEWEARSLFYSLLILYSLQITIWISFSVIFIVSLQSCTYPFWTTAWGFLPSTCFLSERLCWNIKS